MPNKFLMILVIYIVSLALLNLAPIGGAPSLNEVEVFSVRGDYLGHALIFLPWMVLVWLHVTFGRLSGKARFTSIALWFTFGLIFAVFSEVLQLWLPHRTFNVNDILANLAGLLLGSLVFLFNRNSS